MKSTNRGPSRFPRSRRTRLLAVTMALTGAAAIGTNSLAAAEEIRMDPGPGRHFFMFIDKNHPPEKGKEQWFDAEARILQDGREIGKLEGEQMTFKYSKHWTWAGHSGEQIEVKLRRVITDGKNPTRLDWETVTMPADRNTCFKRTKWDGPMEKVGDSVMGNCTPD